MPSFAAVARLLPRGLSLPEEIWVKRNQAMVLLLWLHVPVLVAMGLLTAHPPLHVAWEVAIPATAAFVGGLKLGGRPVSMVTTTFGLLTCSALLVHFSGGVIEMHFHFFVIVAAVTLYQAWLPFLFAIAYVVGQHGVMGALDAASVYNHPAAQANPWRWAVIHGAFILGESVVLLLVWRMNEDARTQMEASYTDLLKEEHQKSQAEERYRRIFERALEGIYETTASGEFTAVNPGLVRILGYESADALMKTTAVDAYVELADRDRFLAYLKERGAVNGFRFRARRADGEIRWLSNHATALRDADGEIIAIQGMIEDITSQVEADEERADLETQLRHAQKMDAIGQLAGGVAHDFNNLLSVIQNYTDFAMEGLDRNDQRYEDLQEVRRASGKGAALIEQLLAFSRKEDAEMATVLDPNDAILDFMKMLGRTLGENIQLEANFDPARCPIRIGEGQLEQILMNLAVNARDAMPNGGRVTFATERLDANAAALPPGLNPRNAYLKLTVDDEGEGIPEEIQVRLFEPFFTTKDRGRGTGLGLATVYAIVQQWHGFIEVDSEPGQGTRFSVYLPGANMPNALAPEPPAAAPGEGQGRVLVVEDEAELLHLVCRILSRNGYEPVPASSPAVAKEILERTEEHLDLLLTDVVMPGGSGPEVAVAARERYPDLPVIFMSGYAGGVLDRHKSALDNQVLLAKPFSADELLNQVRKSLKVVATR